MWQMCKNKNFKIIFGARSSCCGQGVETEVKEEEEDQENVEDHHKEKID